MPRIMSADVVPVSLTCHNGAWSLDLQQLLDAATPNTRIVLVNSPNNPTGWTMPQHDWDQLLAHCRRHGIWLVSDDAYERIVFEPSMTINGHAPSVLSQIGDDDRVISANTFSKSWTMTGWRLGWIVAPRRFIAQLGKVIEFNTRARRRSCSARDWSPSTTASRACSKPSRVCTLHAICSWPRWPPCPEIEVAPPPGAMYLFFRIVGRSDDSVALAKQLVAEAGLGLARVPRSVLKAKAICAGALPHPKSC